VGPLILAFLSYLSSLLRADLLAPIMVVLRQSGVPEGRAFADLMHEDGSDEGEDTPRTATTTTTTTTTPPPRGTGRCHQPHA